jgi:hypothetical protein
MKPMNHVTAASGSTEEPPLAGGVFQRLSTFFGRWGGLSVPVVEELYGPTRHQARLDVEEQRRAAAPIPAPTDPPEFTDVARKTGRASRRFHGLVVLRRP